MNRPRAFFDFTRPDAEKEWRTVNDGVMGGVSEGRLRITDQKTLAFSGTLSLDNNGGFASARTRPGKLGLLPGDALVVRTRGDGRTYSINLYLDRPAIAFSYRAPLPTRKGEWLEARVPLADFTATSFGRVVDGAGPVDPTEIVAVGFMLSDKTAGPFALEVEWIKADSPRG